MNRRAFLRALLAAVSAMALDPERLLWVPRQMIVVPAMPLAGILDALKYTYGADRLLYLAQQEMVVWNLMKTRRPLGVAAPGTIGSIVRAEENYWHGSPLILS
mgnify:CR=1 FL=1